MTWALLRVKLNGIGYSMTHRNGKKKSPVMAILTACLILYVISIFTFMSSSLFSTIGSPLLKGDVADGSAIYFTASFLLGIAVACLGSVNLALVQIYEAKDNDLLLSMPVSPASILLSRILLLGIYSVVYTGIVQIPSAVIYILMRGFDIGVLIRFFVLFIGNILFSLAITIILAWLFSLLFKTPGIRKAVQMIFPLLFVGVYIYFYTNSSSYMLKLIEAIGRMGEPLRKYCGLFWLAGNGVSGDYIMFAIYALIAFGSFALAYYILSKTFIKIVTAKAAVKKVKYVEKEAKVRSAVGALYIKELQRYISLPLYITNTAMGPLMAIVIPVLISTQKNVMLEVFGAMGMPDSILLLIASFGIGLMSVMSLPASSSVSLEGKAFPLLCSLPVNAMQICKGKLLLSLTVSVPASVILTVVSAVILKAEPLTYLPMVLLPVMMSLFVSLWGLTMNLKNPKLDWDTPVKPIKQDTPTMVATLGGMCLHMFTTLISVLLAIVLPVVVILCIACMLYGIISLIIYLYLRKNADRFMLAAC